MEPKNRLRQLRVQHDLDQAQAAELLGVTSSQYSKIERGASQLDAAKLMILAGRYQVSIDYLLGLSSDPGTPPAARPAPDPIREGILAEVDRLDLTNRRLLYAIAVLIRQAQEQRQLAG